MADLVYAWKSYNETVYALARGVGNVKARLYAAFREIVFLPDSAIPPEILPHVI